MAETNVNKDDSYAGYYIFVLISSVIGFIALMALSKISIRVLAEKGVINLPISSTLVSVIISSVGVVLFISIALLLKSIFKKVFLSELFMYLYMGVLTTAVNIIAFQKFIQIFATNGTTEGVGWKIAEALAFIIAVLFAYITNKIFVFKSTSFAPSLLIRELAEFTGARLITELINFVIMWFMIDKKGLGEFFTKVVASVIVIILNYIFSKFIIFKKSSNV